MYIIVIILCIQLLDKVYVHQQYDQLNIYLDLFLYQFQIDYHLTQNSKNKYKLAYI